MDKNSNQERWGQEMGNKTDVIVKLVLVLFISLLSFAVGTYVGRKTSDTQHKMASLEPGNSGQGHVTNREVASEGENHASEAKGAGSESLTDEEIAKLAEEFVTDGHETKPEAAHETKSAPDQEVKPVSQQEPKTEVKPVSKTGSSHEVAHHEPKPQTGKTPVEGIHEAPAKNIEPERVPSSIPKDVAQYSVGKFTVQIGSFASKVEAEKRSSELADKGYKAFVIPAKISGKNWFRVSVGLFATEKEAKDYKTEFMAKGKVENAIVQKILN